jgi:hypothetical protein
VNRTGILLQMRAKPGKQRQVERILKGTKPWAEQEFGAAAYFVFKLGGGRFGIFITSEDEKARDAQRCGRIADVLFAAAKELFDPLPIGENVEILVMKLPAPEYMKRERAESGGKREHLSRLELSKKQEAGLASALMRNI